MQPNSDPVPALKRDIAAYIAKEVRGLPQSFAAFEMGTNQSRVSDICNGRLDRFSLEKLIRMAARLNCGVTLETTEARLRYGKGRSARAQGAADR